VYRLLVVLLAAFLMACAAPQKHTRAGPAVREIQPESAAECRFLETLDGSEESGWDDADKRQDALDNLRDQVVLMGGNAFVLKQSTDSGDYTLVQADVYKCP